MNAVPKVLSVAGSDPSGGAGIQGDLKTFGALGCYGMAAITALTAQNTRGVTAVHVPPADFVAAEIDAIFADIGVDAVKIGMLANAAIVESVGARLAHWQARNIVLDPVLVATSGDSLGAPGVVEAMLLRLLPLAAVVTPNLQEAGRLAGVETPSDPNSMRRVGAAILARGARAVLMKGAPRRRCARSSGDALRRTLLRGPARSHAQYAWNGLHAVFGHSGHAGARPRARGGGRQGQGVSDDGAANRRSAGRRRRPRSSRPFPRARFRLNRSVRASYKMIAEMALPDRVTA